MLSSVLRSRRAIHVNIAIMRVFVRIREVVASNAELRGGSTRSSGRLSITTLISRSSSRRSWELMDPSERGGEGEKIGPSAPSPKSGSP